jgi:hypothetical protein
MRRYKYEAGFVVKPAGKPSTGIPKMGQGNKIKFE